MARVKLISKPGDYPGIPDDATRKDLAELFGYLFPDDPDPEIDEAHAGLAIAAQNPKLALHLARMSRFIALDLPWCRHHDLRELAIQTVHLHFKCDFSFQARLPHAQAAGIGPDMLDAIPDWRTTSLFTEEQRLVIEYAYAVVTGDVPGELFSRIVAQFGEKGAVECTSAIGWWSFWAMLINATRPEFAPPAR